jgi:perosamine synthetase
MDQVFDLLRMVSHVIESAEERVTFEAGLLGMSIHIGTSPHPWAQGVRKQLGAGLTHYLEVISVVDAAHYIGHAAAIPKLFQSAWYDPDNGGLRETGAFRNYRSSYRKHLNSVEYLNSSVVYYQPRSGKSIPDRSVSLLRSGRFGARPIPDDEVEDRLAKGLGCLPAGGDFHKGGSSIMSNTEGKTQETRRSFVKTGGLAVAGLAGSSSFAKPSETLAMNGGPKTVSFPADRFRALTAWPRYGQPEKDALTAMISSGKYYEELALFENEWKAFTKAPFAKSHMNGTSAETAMFFATFLPPGSEIMVPSHTFFATVAPMRFFGYVPVFIDVDPRTGNFDVGYAEKHLTKLTRALCPVHSSGLPCEMDKITDFAKKHGLMLLEDAAHAQGASMQGNAMGTWGVMGITSFQASKPMPGIEGGMGMYSTREYYERAATFGHYEDPPKFPADSPYRKYDGTGFGQKYRMHPFAAAVLRVRLRGLEDLNNLTRKRVGMLNDRLIALAGLSEPYCRPDQKRIYYGGNRLCFDERKAGFSKAAAVKALKAEGVSVRVSATLQEQHKFKLYSEAKWWHHAPQIPEVLPGDEELQKISVGLPLFYEDVPELVDQYVKAFEKVWAHKAELAKA